MADLVGRDRVADAIRGVLLADADPGVVPVCVIAGMAGVGKTALAVHLTHSLAPSFPDGQLFVPLHGCEQRYYRRSGDRGREAPARRRLAVLTPAAGS